MSNQVFRTKRNRPLVSFDEYGFVPVAIEGDDIPVFETNEPRKIGDEAIVRVEGKRRLVRLLRSNGMVKDETWLVDIGPA